MDPIAMGIALLAFVLVQLVQGKALDPITFTRVVKGRDNFRYWGGVGSWLLLAVYVLLASVADVAALMGWELLVATLLVPLPSCVGLYMQWRLRGDKYA